MWGFESGTPSRRKQWGLGADTPAFGDFCNFLIKAHILGIYLG